MGDSLKSSSSLKRDLDEMTEEEEGEIDQPLDIRTLLTAEEIELYKQFFDAYESETIKGKVPTKTIGIFLRSIGLNPSKSELKKFRQEVDPDNKGVIDFWSFLLPIARKKDEVPETYEDIIEAFKVFDENEEGTLSIDVLNEYLTTLGEELEDFEIELFFKMADPKATGKVNYVEFVEKMFGITKKDKKKKGKKKKK